MGKLTIDDEPDAVGGLFGHGFGIVDKGGNIIQSLLTKEHLEAAKRVLLYGGSEPAPQPYENFVHPKEVMKKHTHKPKKKPKGK